MFKDKMNRWVTAGLFKETCGTSTQYVLMSLDEAGTKFVSCGDMTGYVFANEHMGGFKHWCAMKASKALQPHIQDWEDELEMKIRSQALRRVNDTAKEGHFQANKFLADRGWQTRKAGRPSKAEVEREINKDKKLVSITSAFMNPIER